MLNKNFFDKYEADRFMKDLQRDKIIFDRTRRKDMKAHLFVPTGEVRPPKTNEWYMSYDGSLGVCKTFGVYELPIFTRHEIEIPDYAHSLQINAIYGTGNIQNFYAELIRFPICQKKPKVKKWKWVCGYKGSVDVTGYRTERQLPGFVYDWYHKIPETEIEVEE